jgi:hypothetical protein
MLLFCVTKFFEQYCIFINLGAESFTQLTLLLFFILGFVFLYLRVIFVVLCTGLVTIYCALKLVRSKMRIELI